MPKIRLSVAAAVASLWTTQFPAEDWTDARCGIYQRGSDRSDEMILCVFAQRQGAVTITRDDVGVAPWTQGEPGPKGCRRAQSFWGLGCPKIISRVRRHSGCIGSPTVSPLLKTCVGQCDTEDQPKQNSGTEATHQDKQRSEHDA
jgi:hypothetical protein